MRLMDLNEDDASVWTLYKWLESELVEAGLLEIPDWIASERNRPDQPPKGDLGKVLLGISDGSQHFRSVLSMARVVSFHLNSTVRGSADNSREAQLGTIKKLGEIGFQALAAEQKSILDDRQVLIDRQKKLSDTLTILDSEANQFLVVMASANAALRRADVDESLKQLIRTVQKKLGMGQT